MQDDIITLDRAFVLSVVTGVKLKMDFTPNGVEYGDVCMFFLGRRPRTHPLYFDRPDRVHLRELMCWQHSHLGDIRTPDSWRARGVTELEIETWLAETAEPAYEFKKPSVLMFN